MLKKMYFIFICAFLLGVVVSNSYAYPQYKEYVSMAYYYQGAYSGILGCQNDDLSCLAARADHPISKYGCALTSMAMLYSSYGFLWTPDANHNALADPSNPQAYLTPSTLNNYLAGPIDPSLALQFSGFSSSTMRGFTSTYDLDWLKTTSNVYYSNVYIYNGLLNIRPYRYIVPNYDCTPIDWQIQKKNGSFSTVSKSAKCFNMDWTTAGAMTWLDYDIDVNQNPPVAKIEYTTNKDGHKHTHFVVMAGYDPATGGDGGYLDYNPGIRDITVIDPEPKSLIGKTQYGQTDESGEYPFKFNRIVSLYRFTPWWAMQPLDTSKLDITVHSPVEIQVIDPDGNLIGYDPETGKSFLENPMSLYYMDTPVTPLDGTDSGSEPSKRLTIIQPHQGNYILNIFGTGDGPYTIDLALTKSDGMPSLITQLTGTATPSLLQTYRITYSPTGEASLTQSDQAPIANAGTNQTGEQSYEISLDGSGSYDPDGDPMTYTWSFLSKPNGSLATLSDLHAIKPIFIPDLPGSYVLQLVVNDHIADSAPSLITVTATPVKSRIAISPNLFKSISAGPGLLSFDLNNVGRINISSGIINASLVDPNGVLVSSGSQAFSLAVGGTTTVNIPISVPSLKFGNYTLTYSQSDETTSGSVTTVTIPNTSIITFSLDKTIYRVRDTANMTAVLSNSGKFNLDNAALTVSVPDAGYTSTQTVNCGTAQNLSLQYAILIPSDVVAGQHAVNITLSLPSGSSVMQTAKIVLQESKLVLNVDATTQYAAGGTVNVTVENQGSVDTSYTSQQLSLVDNIGNVLYKGNLSDSISAGDKKSLINIPIPYQIIGNIASLLVTLQDAKTNKLTSLNSSLEIQGLQSGISTITDKNVYLNTDTITGITRIANGQYAINGGTLKVLVTREKAMGTGQFAHLLPKSNWFPFSLPFGIAMAPDGSVYVTDIDRNVVLKFDSNGKLLFFWGGSGSGTGQFNYPYGVAVGPDGSVYIADCNNNRIQKFDSNGVYLTSWGSYGTGNSQFEYPVGIATGPDGSVYVSESAANRIQKFDANGNYLTKWGSYGSGNGQFNTPYGIAIGHDGSVYVTDGNNNRIQKFTSSGSFLTKWGTKGSGNGQLAFPICVAIGPDESVYVTDSINYRIVKFDSNGNYLGTWGSMGTGDGQFYMTNGIAVSPDGFVYVADDTVERIQIFNNNGTYINQWGSLSNAEGHFYNPVDVAIGSDGSQYVVDSNNNRIQKFDDKSNYLFSWGSTGSNQGQFSYPSGITIGLNGAIYITDSGNNRVQKFDANGNYLAQWGSSGSGNGQFSGPIGIAVGQDNSIYVADSSNYRIQKFDSNGNYLAKWGSYGSNNGQFKYPNRIAVGADGMVYVADSSNHRVQEFDSNGTFLTKWGSYGTGNGQFEYPQGVAVHSDGTVYVSEGSNQRIQKFDSNGNYLAKWGSYGIGNGQFQWPCGLKVVSDGSVYVADSGNDRIQRMVPIHVGTETLFETTVSITQATNTDQTYSTLIDPLNTTGKLYLQAELQNELGQTVAAGEYPFYVVEGNTVISFSTENKIYKPGDAITITGQVTNLAALPASGVNLSLVSLDPKGGSQNIYGATIDVPANSSYPFTVTTTAGAAGTYMLTGSASQNAIVLATISDQYEVALPAASLTISGPDVVDKNPFNLNVQIVNTGKFDNNNMHYSITDSNGNIVDSNSVGIPAGETRILNYTRQLGQNTTYTANLSGDVVQVASKTVLYGEALNIAIGSGMSVYPEGQEAFPIILTNTGQTDETVTVAYQLVQGTGGTVQESKSYFIPKGMSINDTLSYSLTQGNYQLTASSQLPLASAMTAFTVLRTDAIAMTTTSGSQGANGLIPVTINLVNDGYNDINGTIGLAVANNLGKVIWRGEAQVTSLKSRSAANYIINVDSTDILAGAYPVEVTFYDTSGIQLAINQSQIKVLGPMFEISTVPANASFTQGTQAELVFAIKNSGTFAGTANLAVSAADMMNQSISNTLQPGEQKTYSFDFAVPEDEVASNYVANYALTSPNSQGTSGTTAFNISAVKFDLVPSLDKQVYSSGETAVLNLGITKHGDFQDGTFMVIISYGAFHDLKTFTSSVQPVTLTFNVPLTQMTGNRLFYGVYFQSGKRITENSLNINMPPVVIVVSPAANGIFNSAFTISASAIDGGFGISAVEYQVGNRSWQPLILDPSTGVFSAIWNPTASDEGLLAINFRATDTLGDASNIVSTSCSIDLTPPVTVMNVGTPQYTSVDGLLYASALTTFSYSSSDNLAGVTNTEYRVDGGVWTPYSASFTISSEGTHTIDYRSTDNAGNLETTKSLSLFIDRTPPSGTIAINGSASSTNNTFVDLTLSCTDVASGCSGMQFSNDNVNWYGAENYVVSKKFTLSQGDGTKYVYVRYLDNVGNISSSHEADIVLDTTPPTAAILGAPESPTNKTSAVLAVSGSDVQEYRYQLDVAPMSTAMSVTAPIIINALADGPHKVIVIGKDSAGNWQNEANATTASWVVDTQPPALSLSALPDGAYTNNSTLNIAGIVTDNLAVQGVTINNGNVTLNPDGTFSQALILAPGPDVVTTVAADTAGNTTMDTRTIILDQTAPVITIATPVDNSVTNELVSTVTGSVDKTATVTVSLNDETASSADMSGTYFSMPLSLIYGQNTIHVAATDLAGNTATAKRTVTLDNVNPVLAITNPAQDITTDQTSILLQGTVADLTGTTVTITVDGFVSTPTVSSGVFQQQITFADQKTYAVVATATDSAGNKTTVQRNIIYQKTPTGTAGLSYSGPVFIAQGKAVTLSGTFVSEGANSPDPSGKTITFTLGAGAASQSCTGTTDREGEVSCKINQVTAPLGPVTVTMAFSGDSSYPAASASSNVTVFAYPAAGAFVIGDNNAAINGTVLFWGAQWVKNNSLSGGPAPSSFKGYAGRTSDSPPECESTWSARPGNSSNPPASIPSYMAVIVSSNIRKSGSTITGNTVEIVIVKTDPGYGPDPEHAGTGTTIGILRQCRDNETHE